MQQLVHKNCIEQNSANMSMSVQYTNQHVNTSVSKRQPKFRINIATHTSMYNLVSVNQHDDPTH